MLCGRNGIKSLPKRCAAVFQVALVVLLAAAGIINYQIYFDRQSVSFTSWMAFSTPETIIGRIMAQMGNQVDYYVSTFYYQTPTIQFLAPDVTYYHVLQTNETLPLRLDSTRRDGHDRGLRTGSQFFLQAKQYYPKAGLSRKLRRPPDRLLYMRSILRPEDISSIQGLTASYYRDAKWDEKPDLVRNETNFSLRLAGWRPAAVSLMGWNGKECCSPPPTGLIVWRSIPLAAVDADHRRGAGRLEREGGEDCRGCFWRKGTIPSGCGPRRKDGHFELDWAPPG